MCIQVSPGKAYVAGYDVELDSTATIDVENLEILKMYHLLVFLLKWDIF